MKSALYIISLFLLFGCYKQSGNQYKFFHVSELNNDLRKAIKIDINQQKVKADSVFNVDPQFYKNLLIEMIGGADKNCFQRSNIARTPLTIEGKPFSNVNEYDSIASIIMARFADNMIIENCSGKSIDSLCMTKERWYSFMSGEKEAQLSYGFFFSGLEELYVKNYTSEEEFHYLILYLHYLGVFNGTS